MKTQNFYTKNQFIIEDDNNNLTFQSYDSEIANIKDGVLTLHTNWDYSLTTQKYLYMFLSEYAYKIHDLELRSVIVNMMKYCNNKRQHLQALIDIKFINYVED